MTIRTSFNRNHGSLAGVHRVIFVLAAIPLCLGLWGTWLGLEMRDWPTVEATIVDGSLSLSKARVDRHRHRSKVSASWEVTYTYDLRGETYEGVGIERGAFGMMNSATARRYNRQFRNGAKATVWLNPNDPAESYLVNGVSGPAKVLTGIGGVLVLFGFLARWITAAGERGPAAPTRYRPQVAQPVVVQRG